MPRSRPLAAILIAFLFTALTGAAVLRSTAVPAASAAPSGPGAIHVVTLSASGPHSYAEPGIALGPHGLGLIDAASANTGAPPTVWLSRNGGRSWSGGRDFDAPDVATGDADVAIGPDGTLYALDLGYANPPAQPANPTVEVYRSRDGRAWQGPAKFPAPHGSDQPDRPWLIVDPHRPADVDVVNSEGAGNIVIWRSTDRAASFSGPTPVTGGANSQAALTLGSRPLFDPSRPGRLFMLYETTAPGGGPSWLGSTGATPYEFPLTQLWLASSEDGGGSWSSRLALDTAALPGADRDATLGHLLVASSIDRRGVLYAALSVRPAGGTETRIEVLRSVDHGLDWSAPLPIPSPARSNVMPALAVAPSGAAYLSWYASSDPDFRSAAAHWRELAAWTGSLTGRRPRFRFRTLTSAPVHIGGIDTAGNVASNLGADWGLRDLQSLALDGCGRPHAVWADDAATPPRAETAAFLGGCPASRRRK